MTTTNKPMTGEQLDELMTVAVNMQRAAEVAKDRGAAMFSHAVQIAVMEIRDTRSKLAESQREFRAADATIENLQMQVEKLAAENAALKESRKNLAEFIHEELNADYPLNMDIETPATNAVLAEVSTNAIKSALDDCSEYLDRDCIMETNGISYEDAALREEGAMALHNALLRQGGAA